MDLEQRFLGALGKVTAYRLDGGGLQLLDDQGTAILRFEAGRSD
jgi:heat shock protein HslJ